LRSSIEENKYFWYLAEKDNTISGDVVHSTLEEVIMPTEKKHSKKLTRASMTPGN
jgi:hypothetical protein